MLFFVKYFVILRLQQFTTSHFSLTEDNQDVKHSWCWVSILNKNVRVLERKMESGIEFKFRPCVFRSLSHKYPWEKHESISFLLPMV